MYIMREGKKCNKIVSLVLAAVMMVSVFAVATPLLLQFQMRNVGVQPKKPILSNSNLT